MAAALWPCPHQARLDETSRGSLRDAITNCIAAGGEGGVILEQLHAALQPLLQRFPPCDSSVELRVALAALEEDFLIYKNGQRFCKL